MTFKSPKFKSSYLKRYALVNAVMDSGYNGSLNDWLTEKNMDIYDLTDKDIDLLLTMFHEIKS